MKYRFDFAISYERGTFNTSEHLDKGETPSVGQLRTFEIEGKPRTVKISEILGAVIYEGIPRTPVYGRTVDNL